MGWRGLCSGLIEKILGQFESATLSVYVGPFLHSFEIKKDLCYEQIVAKFGVQFFREEKGRIVFNFKRAVESLLPSSATFDLRDTATNPTLPSYRRDKTPVRLVTTVRLA